MKATPKRMTHEALAEISVIVGDALVNTADENVCSDIVGVFCDLTNEHADRMYTFTYSCVDCSHVVHTQTVSEGAFIEAREKAWAQLERWGETETSPVIRRNRIYYSTLCNMCRDGLMAELYEG
jgi:hypothetical protein